MPPVTPTQALKKISKYRKALGSCQALTSARARELAYAKRKISELASAVMDANRRTTALESALADANRTIAKLVKELEARSGQHEKPQAPEPQGPAVSEDYVPSEEPAPSENQG